MKTYYQIAGLVLEIDAEEKYLHAELGDFQIECSESVAPDIRIDFAEEVYAGQYPEQEIVQAELLTIYELEDRYIVRYNQPIMVECYEVMKNESVSKVYLKREDEQAAEAKERIMYSIRDAFFFHMQKRDRVAVHSASIVYQDRVWLFSASSGTGKSTHVEQWKQAGYEIESFNGDVAVCYAENGQAYAAGIPWCGTSGIYCNKTLPLGGIMFLQRSCHNSAGKLNAFEGIVRLNARCLTPNWNQELMECNLHVAEQLARVTTLGILACTPEPEAATVAKKFIDEQIGN